MERLYEYFHQWWERRERLLRFGPLVGRVSATVFCAYLAAGAFSALLVPMLGKATVKPALPSSQQVMSGITLDKPNFTQIRKMVMERNIFNSDGKFPDEKEKAAEGSSGGVFNAGAACSPTTLSIELLGTIYTGRQADSVATIKDKDYPEADIYRAGDAIIGNEQARIYSIERSRVVINNSNSKECLELQLGLPESIASIQDAVIPDQNSLGAPKPATEMPVSSEPAGNVTVEQSFVEKELGAGMANILTKARLVPNVVEGGVQGFKIFAIEGGCLFDKVGLHNGDVITRINEISLQQPEQGFALYEAFQNDKEVRIYILRDGSTPKTINVRIR